MAWQQGFIPRKKRDRKYDERKKKERENEHKISLISPARPRTAMQDPDPPRRSRQGDSDGIAWDGRMAVAV